MPKVGVFIPTSTTKGGRVIADLDTRSGELYASVDEVLPGERSGAAGESDFAVGARPGGFAGSRELFDAELQWLAGEEAAGLSGAFRKYV